MTSHIIWDWNGTLLNDVQYAVDTMNSVLADCDLPSLDVERYRGLFRFPVRSYYEDLGFTEEHGGFVEIANRFIGRFEERVRHCDLQDSVRTTLEHLSARGTDHTILSAARQVSLRDQVAHHGIGEFFNDVLGLDNHFAAGKTDIGLAWISQNHIDIERTVFVGDTDHDFEVAQAMGVACILVSDGHQSKAILEKCGCPVVDSIDEFAGLV